MNSILNKYTSFLQLTFAVLIAICCASCEDNETNKSIIHEVRNYAAAPLDTTIEVINSGQWVVILGQNLSSVKEVYFASVRAAVNLALISDESIVVQVPEIPFESIPIDQINQITLVSDAGITMFEVDIVGPPIITHARNFDDIPNDTLVNSVVPGQKVNLIGYNLVEVTSIEFQGVEANLNNIILTDSSAIIEVPLDLSGGDATKANTITFTTKYGTTSFNIKIIGPPIITHVSYENPFQGDSVYLMGNNFIGIQSLTFAGTPITEFNVFNDGELIGFVTPALTQSGPVEITTLTGTFTTNYNVNDITTGAISNFEWGDNFRWAWWGGASLETGNPDSGWPPYNAAFAGNTSMFLVLKNANLESGSGDEFSTCIRMENVQWMPEGNLNDDVNTWAVKFEINVPDAWNGGTITVNSSIANYLARYEPWKISSTKTAPFKTKGWQTVTIPFSEFKNSDGTGTPLNNITDLLGSTGQSNMFIIMHNYGSSTTATSFNAAFDNFRVVRR